MVSFQLSVLRQLSTVNRELSTEISFDSVEQTIYRVLRGFDVDSDVEPSQLLRRDRPDGGDLRFAAIDHVGPDLLEEPSYRRRAGEGQPVDLPPPELLFQTGPVTPLWHGGVNGDIAHLGSPLLQHIHEFIGGELGPQQQDLLVVKIRV